MTVAWSKEWFDAQMESCKTDDEYQAEADGLDRSFTAVILADPDRGVAEDAIWGFYVPTMDREFHGPDSAWETDFYLEGTYEDWRQVNEGEKGLVAALLDESIALRRGSTSYLAMFVPAVERFFALSRSNTDVYEGDFGESS